MIQYRQQTQSQKETSEEQQLVKSQEEQQRHDLLIEEIKKQPLIIPLIKSLNKEANVVNVIKGESDGSDVTGKEQRILQQINKVDDRVLRTLIDFKNKAWRFARLLARTNLFSNLSCQ